MKKQLIYGFHPVETLLKTKPHEIFAIFMQQDKNDQRTQTILNLAKINNIAIQHTSRPKLDEFVSNAHHQGIVAEVSIQNKYSEADLSHLISNLTEPAFILILDGVLDPHNLGACLRSANAAGIHMVIAPKNNAVGITPVVSKVASGAAEITPFIQVTNLARTIKLLKEHNIWVYGAVVDTDKNFYSLDLKGPIALVIGAEEKGLRRLTRESCDVLAKIPMAGEIASLNVSVATGICLFEAVRQRICHSGRKLESIVHGRKI
jgi:23S rRNA (guanosine2251-2'-O)-methyltransferase